MVKPREANLWDRFDRAQKGKALSTKRRFRWVVDATIPLILLVVIAIAVLLPPDLSREARFSLFSFAFAIVLWSTTSLNAAYVAMVSVLLLVLSGGEEQEELFEALESDVIWLMIGAFMLGEAVQKTGLAGRLTQWVVARSRSVASIFWLLTTILIPLTFLIPSTSGRAAVVIPVFQNISQSIQDHKVTRALALLIPSIILVSTIVALVGAGSHLIALDLLSEATNQRISFTQWALYGLPFGVAASYSTCWVVLKLFLEPERSQQILKLPEVKPRSFSKAEKKTLAIVAVLSILWLTESWHGLEIATSMVIGAIALTAPKIGVLSWKDGLKAVSWNLVIFVGAALVLGEALIESGAAQWLISTLFNTTGIQAAQSPLLVLVILSLISLTSHLYMTSHAARTIALIPAMLYLALNLNLNPTAVLFISTVGIDYCLTFPVSSKALLMFQELESETFQPTDLLRLSAVMLLVHLGLMVVFYYGYWRWIGLEL